MTDRQRLPIPYGNNQAVTNTQIPTPQGAPGAVTNCAPNPIPVPRGAPAAVTGGFLQQNAPLGTVNVGATPDVGVDWDTITGLAGNHQAALQAAMAQIQANAALSRAGIGAQQANIGLDREIARHGLDTGLRDLEQARMQGVEDATSNALQRGIYNSGIRQENQQTVNREAAEGKSDMKKEFDFTMRGLANRAAGLSQQLAAIGQVMQAQMMGAQVGADAQWDQIKAMLSGAAPGMVDDSLNQQPQATPSGGGGGSRAY